MVSDLFANYLSEASNMPNICDGTILNTLTFSQKVPSCLFDRVMNTPPLQGSVFAKKSMEKVMHRSAPA